MNTGNDAKKMDDERIRELRSKIAEVKARWPAHSVPPALMQQLDELEEELARALQQSGGEEQDG